jgi:hypothetical protein
MMCCVRMLRESIMFDVRNGYMYCHLEHADIQRKNLTIRQASEVAQQMQEEMTNAAGSFFRKELRTVLMSTPSTKTLPNR